MARANIGLLIFLYCLKTLGWVATTVGVFLALSYLRSWLNSAWKNETERSSRRDNRENTDQDEYLSTENGTNIENTDNNTNVSSVENSLEASRTAVNSASTRHDL